MTEETLFAAALEKRTPAERAAFLDEACAGDTALQRRVEALLLSHDHASFLKTPAIQQAAEANGSESTSAEPVRSDVVGLDPSLAFVDWLRKPGKRDERDCNENLGPIGRYQPLQKIGEGGMGTVYMAEQEHPVRRRVALKLIKAGMDSRQVIARFEAERQALALMDHPNIARVLDAGATDSGRPYFVMELVRGIPITRFCDEQRLTPRQRLELFIPVCQAVQHAHQKGIIHRDIKPSNVLIALYDGEAAPKIIDFGVAKATGPRLTEETLHTEFGAVVGTLEYMSPEQAELNPLDIDTRSDIYSLGVLLYELLTGTTPLRRNRLERPALLEALRIIREEEPRRPSTRLSTTEELPSIAANRSLEPRRLSGMVRGELDWIVMKALEKDRARRYETANGLAMDIHHYLADEPVQACPPFAIYDPASGQEVHPFKRTPAPVPGLVFSPDSRHLISAGASDPAVKIWDVAAEKFSFEIRQIGNGSSCVAVSPDGRRIAAPFHDHAAGEHTAKIWDVNWDATTYAEFRTLKRHPGWVFKVAFSSDGRYLATGSWDSTIKVWDLEAPASAEPVTLRGHAGFICGLAFSPDGRRLASASGYADRGEVKVWDATMWDNRSSGGR